MKSIIVAYTNYLPAGESVREVYTTVKRGLKYIPRGGGCFGAKKLAIWGGVTEVRRDTRVTLSAVRECVWGK